MLPNEPATPVAGRRIFQYSDRISQRLTPSAAAHESNQTQHNPFLRTPTFTIYRDKSSGRPSGDNKDDDEEEEEEDEGGSSPVAFTPLPRRNQPWKSKSSLSIEVGPFTPRRSMPDLERRRRPSDAMLSDDPGNNDDESMDNSSRRSSLSLRPLNRIATLLKEESNPLEKEIAHERAINTSQSAINNPFSVDSSSSMDDETPPESPGMRNQRAMSVAYEDDSSQDTTSESLVPVPVKPIPNSALKDPATYVSHSSKLNPENHFISKQQEMMMCSPLMSPIHPTMSCVSPSNLERKGKRKLSGEADRFESYKRHRMPSSPTIHSPTYVGGQHGGSYFGIAPRTGTTPPPFSLPYPLVFQRQRSPSVSSTSSASSMWGIERNSSSLSNSGLSANSTPGSAPMSVAGLNPAHPLLAQGNPPPSPRSLGQMLNLTGTQEGFTKMSIT